MYSIDVCMYRCMFASMHACMVNLENNALVGLLYHKLTPAWLFIYLLKRSNSFNFLTSRFNERDNVGKCTALNLIHYHCLRWDCHLL